MQQTLVQAFALRRSSETAGNALSSLGYPGPPFRASAPLQGPHPKGLRRRKSDFRPEAPHRIARYDSSPRNETRIHGARSESILHFSLVS